MIYSRRFDRGALVLALAGALVGALVGALAPALAGPCHFFFGALAGCPGRSPDPPGAYPGADPVAFSFRRGLGGDGGGEKDVRFRQTDTRASQPPAYHATYATMKFPAAVAAC